MNALAAAGSRVLDLLFPPACELCGAACEGHLCDACAASIRPRDPRVCCRVCGKTLIEDDRAAGALAPLCRRCRTEPPAFALARSAAAFHGPMGTLVHKLKYAKATWLAGTVARFMAQCFRDAYGAERVDLVCPVPLHPAKELARGYNQAALLAAALGERLSLPARADLLLRVRDTATQTRMDADERRVNVRGAFAAAPGAAARLAGKTVLLVDDVMTTGATFGACAAVLRDAGAARVLALSAARD